MLMLLGTGKENVRIILGRVYQAIGVWGLVHAGLSYEYICVQIFHMIRCVVFDRSTSLDDYLCSRYLIVFALLCRNES